MDIWEIEYNLQSCTNKEGGILSNCDEEWQPDEDSSSTTDPLDEDSDNDGINDGDEDQNRNGKLDPYDEEDEPCDRETDPTNADTDGGGRSDFEECDADSTDPRNGDDDVRDTDEDGIFDQVEDTNCISVSYTHLTLPTNREV